MNTRILFIFCLLLCLKNMKGQAGRYQKAIFPQNNIQTNIQYGSADSYDVFGLNNPLPQHLDFYEPLGDTAAQRPLVLVFFGGAFLVGDKGMEDMVAWCDSLAAYGYVCAAVNYRIGFNPLSAASSIRAGYRGVQDARAAVRYMKEFHQQFRIDTNLIFMVGNSAGAINAIQTAYGEESDRPAATYGVAGTLSDNNDLGCIDCSGNNYQHTVDVAGVVGCWGAVVDMNGLDTSDHAPIIMFHGADDTTVPIDSGLPFNNGVFPTMYGSRTIHEARIDLGLSSELHVYPGQDHNFYYDGLTFPNTYWDTIWQLTHPFLCNLNPNCTTALAVNSVTKDEFEIQLYPNPIKSKLTIEIEQNKEGRSREIRIYDLLGQEIRTDIMHDSSIELDLSDFEQGVYCLRIELEGQYFTKKIQIE